MLVSTFGISTWMWTLLLWLIDWDCEFQLINFIVLQRATIFVVVGLMWSVRGFFGYTTCVNQIAINPHECDESGPGVTDAAVIKFSQIRLRASYAYIAYAALIAFRLKRLAEQAATNGQPTKLPPWARFVIWIESFKHHHCPIDDTPKSKLPSSPRGSTSKGTNSSNYRHVPSPAEIALAGSVIYGLGIGSVVAVLTAINTLARALMVDMDNPMLAIFAQAGIGLILTLNLTVGVRFFQFAASTAYEEYMDHRAQKARGVEMPKGLSRDEKHLWEVFAKTDKDGSGSIGKDEMEKILREGHYDFSPSELEDMLDEVDKDRSGQLEWSEFKKIAKKLSLMKLPEAGGLGRLLYFEQILWLIAQISAPVYMFTSVGPPHLWEETGGNFFSYLFTLYLQGIEYPAFRRMLYVCATIVYLIAGFPFLLFKVPVLGPAMFGLRKSTGYDRAGNVRAVMTGEELHHKYEKEKKAEVDLAEDSTIRKLIRAPTSLTPNVVSKKVHLPHFGKRSSKHEPTEEDKAAVAIQSRIRGKKARQATAKTAGADADDAKELEKSATTIQSRIRGRAARRAAAKETDASPEVATAEASASAAAEGEAKAKTPRSPRMSLSRMRSSRSSKSQK